MIALAGSDVRKHFKDTCDKVTHDAETVIVTRTRGENVVMISEDEYNNLMENMRILSDPERYTKIMNGIRQLEKGESQLRELLTDDE